MTTQPPRSEFGVGLSRSLGCACGLLLAAVVLIGGCVLLLSGIGAVREEAERAAERQRPADAPLPAMRIEIISTGERGPFVEVAVKATNASQKPITFAKATCVLLNAEGREFAVEEEVIVNPLDGELAAGDSRYSKFLISAALPDVQETRITVDDVRY